MAKPTVLWNTVVPANSIQLMTSSTDVTARQSKSGYSIHNCVDYRTYTRWIAPDTGQQDILIGGVGDSTAADITCDSIGIANHNFGSLGLTVTVYRTSDSETASPVWVQVDQFSPSNDDPIFETFNSASDEYWRISISASGTDFPYMGLLYIGAKTAMVDSFDAGVDPRIIEPMFSNNLRNENGYLIPSAGKGVNRAFDFMLEPTGSTTATHTSIIDDLVDHVRKMRPFFFNYNLDDTIFPNTVLRLAQGGAITRPFVSGAYARMGLNFPVVAAAPEDL